MGEKILEITELEKTFTGFQKIPKGDMKTAYVFFQSKDNSRYIISTERRKIMAAELRLGKYDRIMTIHRGEFTELFQREIACKENGHYFFANIDVKYFIADPQVVYLKKIHDVSREIVECLSEVEDELEQNYGFRESAGLTRDMKRLISVKLGELSYLKCSFQLKIEMDDNAKNIVKREQEHEFTGTDVDLTAMEEQIKLQNTYDLEQARLEREKEIAHLNAELQSAKMDQLGELIRKYGVNAGNMIDLVNGEISGAQLSEAIAKTVRENRSEKINMIFKSYADGILTKELAEQSLISLLGPEDGKSFVGLLEKKESEPKKEQKAETEKFQWNDVDTEDGMIE